MSTITLPASPAVPPPAMTCSGGEERGVMRGVSWDLYLRLINGLDDHSGLRLAYDGTDLEIMTKGMNHEDYRRIIIRVLDAVTRECRIRARFAGETTWTRHALERGIEADECAWFDPEKIATVKSLRAAKVKDISLYPSPELAIEVDISPPKVDRAGIYAAMKVAELWRFDGATMVFEQLGADGKYTAVDRSRLLPLRPSDLVPWLTDPDAGELEWMDRLTEWAKGLAAGANGV